MFVPQRPQNHGPIYSTKKWQMPSDEPSLRVTSLHSADVPAQKEPLDLPIDQQEQPKVPYM